MKQFHSQHSGLLSQPVEPGHRHPVHRAGHHAHPPLCRPGGEDGWWSRCGWRGMRSPWSARPNTPSCAAGDDSTRSFPLSSQQVMDKLYGLIRDYLIHLGTVELRGDYFYPPAAGPGPLARAPGVDQRGATPAPAPPGKATQGFSQAARTPSCGPRPGPAGEAEKGQAPQEVTVCPGSSRALGTTRTTGAPEQRRPQRSFPPCPNRKICARSSRPLQRNSRGPGAASAPLSPPRCPGGSGPGWGSPTCC